MEFHIGEMNSTVRMTDSQSMLSGDVFERLVRAVAARVSEEQERERVARSERSIRPRALAVEGTSWE